MDENKTEKEDSRTIRTKRDLANALEALLAKKPFDEIQVQEIVSLAMVSKKTFYNNFADKDELLQFVFARYEEKMVNDLKPELQKYSHHSRIVFFKKTIESVVHYFYTSDLPFEELVRKDGSKTVYYNLSVFLQKVLKELDEEYDHILSGKENPDITYYFYAGAFSSMLYFAFLNGVSVDEKALSKELIRMSFPAVLS